jgi:DNA-binding transcriptional regulator WhiA
MMKRGAAGNSAKAIQDLGDEAYSWGYSEAIAFRKGNLTVYVSALSDIDSLLPALGDTERTNLRRIEEIAINKSFARSVASFLSNLDKACQTMERG